MAAKVVVAHAEAVVLDDETAALVVDGDVHGELAGVLAAKVVVAAFSSASLALETSSRCGTSLSLYRELVGLMSGGVASLPGTRASPRPGGGVCGDARGAESGHRNARARAPTRTSHARARDGTRDDGGDGGGAPSGVRSRSIRERDARGGRDGRGGARGDARGRSAR